MAATRSRAPPRGTMNRGVRSPTTYPTDHDLWRPVCDGVREDRVKCCICQRLDARIGVLCEDCRDELTGPLPIANEQILTCGTPNTTAVLVDVWGRVHGLSSDTTIGRTTEPPAIAIFEPSVSRRHARIVLADGGWTICDLGSANRTYVDGRRAKTPLPMVTGNRIRIGAVAFFFVADGTGIVVPAVAPMGHTTVRPMRPIARGLTQTIDIPDEGGEPNPDAELPRVDLELQQPTGGGGGVLDVGGKRVQLTVPQYELMARLVERILAPSQDDETVRGFISLPELAGMLSLDTREPGEDHVRQLVRRVRRACDKAGIGNLIESRYGYGYRLAVMPRRKR